MKSSLPEETVLIERIQSQGPTIIDGKQWYLDEQGHLHYRSIPDVTGSQLNLSLSVPMPKDSLFNPS